jgi:hypothetical protein
MYSQRKSSAAERKAKTNDMCENEAAGIQINDQKFNGLSSPPGSGDQLRPTRRENSFGQLWPPHQIMLFGKFE